MNKHVTLSTAAVAEHATTIETDTSHYAMECRNCESRQRHFYCENCIRTQYVSSRCQYLLDHLINPSSSLRDFRLQIQHAATDRDEQVRKVTAAIDTISGSRIRRADLTSSQEKLDELNEGLTQLRRDNDKSEFCRPTHACTP